MMSQLGEDYRCLDHSFFKTIKSSVGRTWIKSYKRIDDLTLRLLRASLEAERNSFMLYLRGEVFIRAALVKVRP